MNSQRRWQASRGHSATGRIVFLALLACVCSVFAEYDVLYSNTFENATMNPWTNIGGDAGLYESNDIVSNMGVDDGAINYAPNGSFCLWDGRGSSYLELQEPLALATDGYTNLTISFNYNCRNGSSTRRLTTQYFDGTNTYSQGYVILAGSKSYTFKSDSYAFTDEAKFRFAFADSGGGAGPFFIDDIVITASPPTPKGMILILQ